MKSLILIVNPISGRSFIKNRIVSRIISYIDRAKYDVTIRFTSYAGHATEIAAEAVEKGVHIVVAVGGDGTINEVAKSLVNTPTILGIVPCGSGNGLARHLHIPMSVRKAVGVINAGTIETIDSMMVNGRPCFCTAGIGYDAQVSAEFAKEKRRGLMTYVIKAIEGWFKYKPQEYIIKTDALTLRRTAFAITCANANQWGNDFHVAPRASLKDGLIDVTIIHPIKFINALSMPFQILGYSFDKNPSVEYIKTSKLTIDKLDIGVAHIDGDPVVLNEPLDFHIDRNSLKVLLRTSAGNI